MSDLDSLLDERQMAHKDVLICLDLNLISERDAAMQAVAAAARTARQSDERIVGGKHPALDAANARVKALDEQIQAKSIILRVYGVDRHTYNQWLVDCPPRKGVQETFNQSEFFLHAAKRSAKYVDKTGAEHEITPAQWTRLDKMTDGEHDRLADAVLDVNRQVGRVDVSFFVNASETTRDSFGISASRETSESHPVASGAGKPKKSTSKKSTVKGDA